MATYDYDLCYLHKVLSPWDINTYLLKYMATIHLPEKKKIVQKEEHFGFFFFLAISPTTTSLFL